MLRRGGVRYTADTMKASKLLKEAARIASPYCITDREKFRLKDFDPGDTDGVKSKKAAQSMVERSGELLAEMQEKLYAQDRWSVLLIFQAMDAAGKDSAIKHIFVIDLENEGESTTFGPLSPATYLNGTLLKQGELLQSYYATGHVSLDNYIAQISGQSPNISTQTDCTTYTDFASKGTGKYGQALGKGCVYPKTVKTIGDQLVGTVCEPERAAATP